MKQPCRIYCRASTDEQNAHRAESDLKAFADEHGLYVATVYVENASGAKLERPELARLLAEANQGDILLIESVDRLSRLEYSEFETLKQRITERGLKLVVKDMPTTFGNLKDDAADGVTGVIMHLINGLLLDLAAAFAREDYTKRRARQAQGIEKAKAEGKFTGRQADTAKHAHLKGLLLQGYTQREITEMNHPTKPGKRLASLGLVNKVAKSMSEREKAAAKEARAQSALDDFENLNIQK